MTIPRLLFIAHSDSAIPQEPKTATGAFVPSPFAAKIHETRKATARKVRSNLTRLFRRDCFVVADNARPPLPVVLADPINSVLSQKLAPFRS